MSTEHSHASAADRARAARLLNRVLTEGRTLDQLEPDAPLSPLVRELLYGAARHAYSLSYRCAALLKRPLKARDSDLWALLLIGAYQLLHTNVPAHAALNETVHATRLLKKPWARGLINGCLRTIAGNAEQPNPAALDTLPRNGAATRDEARFELPQWLIKRLQVEYGTAFPRLAEALAGRAPMTLRVAPGQRDALARALNDHGRHWRTPYGEDSATWILDQPLPVAALPGHAEGCFSVQDAGAQLGQRVLDELLHHCDSSAATGTHLHWVDACAAPGGKLCHALERWQARPHQVTAFEVSESRAAHLHRELSRLRLPGAATTLDVQTADARDQAASWSQKPVDLVLLDAPCSGTGTLRRHPDIRLLASSDALTEHQATQQTLLTALASIVRPGGALLYATCSLLEEENDGVVGTFLEQHDDWRTTAIELPTGNPRRHGWQLTPIDPDTDGFYYAALVKLH
ncbi:MAG: transcription antitermination factor NusB [Pseudomonadota bacterium]